MKSFLKLATLAVLLSVPAVGFAGGDGKKCDPKDCPPAKCTAKEKDAAKCEKKVECNPADCDPGSTAHASHAKAKKETQTAKPATDKS